MFSVSKGSLQRTLLCDAGLSGVHRGTSDRTWVEGTDHSTKPTPYTQHRLDKCFFFLFCEKSRTHSLMLRALVPAITGITRAHLPALSPPSTPDTISGAAYTRAAMAARGPTDLGRGLSRQLDEEGLLVVLQGAIGGKGPRTLKSMCGKPKSPGSFMGPVGC